MLIENLLYSAIEQNDVDTVFKVKDRFLQIKEIKYIEFVRDFYTQYGKLPDRTTVESKFNITLNKNNEKADYWFQEILSSYKTILIEEAIKSSAKSKSKAPDIFQQALIDLNVDNETVVHSYADGKRRAQDYKTRKGTKGITYLSTGSDEIDSFSNGYKKADLWTIGGRESAGKAQPLTAKIMTPNGWTTMGKLKVGDIISGFDGGEQTVTGIFPQGKRPIYKVTFSDKTSTECDLDHLWLCESRVDRDNKTGMKVRSLREIKFVMDNLKNPTKNRFKIPKTNPIEFSKKDLLIEPYTLGVILGDGNITRYETIITNPEKEIFDTLTNISGYSISVRNTSKGKCLTYNLLKACSDITKLGLLGKNSFSKFIPPEYLNTTVSDRIALLQGLMDTDGYVNGASAEFYSRSVHLAEGVKEIVQSLGGFARIRIKEVNNLPAYTVSISFDKDRFVNIFRVSSKANKFIPRDKTASNGKSIVSIDYVRDDEVQCISVSNEDKLYITDDYIVTHNTWFLLRMANWLDLILIKNNIKKPILIISGEMEAIELEERLDSIRCKISYLRLSKGELLSGEERRYLRYLDSAYSNIKIIDTFDGLKDIDRFAVIYQPAIIFIDGSHLLASSYDWVDIARVTANMKKMTRNRKIPVVNTTHLKADKGNTANGGGLDDFAYTKGYTRDSDIVGVMFASDIMTLNNQFGLDWVKVRRANRTQIVYENDHNNGTTKVISNVTGNQLALGGKNKKTGNPQNISGRNGQQVSDMYN